MDIQQSISNILDQHVGETNAISWADLCWAVDPNMDAGELRGVIHTMRQAGALICSSSKGYYRPASYKEVKNFTDRLRQPARDQLLTARILRDAARNEFAGQMEMFSKGG